MRIQMESTRKTVHFVVNGEQVPARVWTGRTEKGCYVHVYVTRVAVENGQPPAVYKEFEKELEEHPETIPADVVRIPLRFIL